MILSIVNLVHSLVGCILLVSLGKLAGFLYLPTVKW